MKITKKKIFVLSRDGRLLFEAYLPELDITGEKNNKNIDSPFTGLSNCFSVYYWIDKWYFKDHSKNISGDIFYFVALKFGLDVKNDFKKITEIIGDKLKEMGCIADESNDTYLEQEETGNMLLIADYDFSKPFIEDLFKSIHPVLKSQNDYDIRLVKAFEIKTVGKEMSYEYQWSKPKETFFSLTIVEGRLYILYNPTTRKFYEWGIKGDGDIIGWRQAIKTAYVDHIYLRQTLFITNTIESLLNFYSLRIPCIAFIEGEQNFPDFLQRVIKPLFSNIHIAYDMWSGRGRDYAIDLSMQNGFERFALQYHEDGRMRSEPDHRKFFRNCLKKEENVDYLYSTLQYDDGLEIDEIENNIKIYKNRKELTDLSDN